MTNFVQVVGIVLCLASTIAVTLANTILQTITGEIGCENYTFYRLNREGFIRVELYSIYGDADLYVSDTTLRPSFDNFELVSATCGLDIIDIPSKFKRPVGVSVYGYPSYFNSSFILKIYKLSDKEEDTYISFFGSNTFFGENEYIMQQNLQQTPSVPTDGDGENEDSPLWTLLISILKIILEILF